MAPSSPLSPAAVPAAPARAVAGHVDDVASTSGTKTMGKAVHASNRASPTTGHKDSNLLHQAAVRRSTTKASTIAPQQPVLVLPGPSASPVSSPATMRKKNPKPTKGATSVPRPDAFSFTSILDSLGPEGDIAIDAIAEICGKSNMSLADEHGLHMPPHGQVEGLEDVEQDGRDTEIDGIITRSVSRRVGEEVQARQSRVNVSTGTAAREPKLESTAASAGFLPQIIAWLRGTGAPENRTKEVISTRNPRQLLDDQVSIRP